VRLPADVARVGTDLVKVSQHGALAGETMPTSIDNMSPGNRFIRALAEIPVSPQVDAHSVISVEGDGPLDAAGDGVVKYRSAHVAGLASEVIVKSPHSGMQAAPQTVEEVRRIFLAHAASSKCPVPARAREREGGPSDSAPPPGVSR
jgi:hypothetical protein